jgi:hypothetical protein
MHGISVFACFSRTAMLDDLNITEQSQAFWSWCGQSGSQVCNHTDTSRTTLTLSIVAFLLFRVLKTGSDTRFDDIRSHFFKFMGRAYSAYCLNIEREIDLFNFS